MTILIINTSSVYQGEITKDTPNKSHMKQPVTDQPKLLGNNCK